MDGSFDAWINFILGASENQPGGEEGGWNWDDPATEPPGQNPTWRGIEYEEACQWCGVDSMEFSNFRALFTRSAIARLARSKYWDLYRVDLLPAGPNVAYADGVFNGGGVANLQAALNALCGAGLKHDNELGPVTIATMRTHLPSIDPTALIRAYGEAAEARYRSLAKFSEDGAGWLARLGRCLALARQLAGRVPAPQEA